MAIILNSRPGQYQFSGNPIMYNLYSAAAAADSDIFFEVRVKFRVLDGDVTPANYETLCTYVFYPTDGVAKVDISGIIDSKLSFLMPDLAATEMVGYKSQLQSCRYWLEWREITAAAPDPAWVETENVNIRIAVKGGVNKMVHRGENYFVNWWGGFAEAFKFLTWQQDGRTAQLDERMYLAYLYDGIHPNLSLACTVYYTDGTTDYVEWLDLLDPLAGQVSFWPVGAGQMDLQALSAKQILKWTVHLFEYTAPSTKNPVSQTFTYYADGRKDYNTMCLHFRNSLGGLDSVTIRGVIEENLNFENQLADVAVDPDYYAGYTLGSQRKIINSTELMIYKGNTGWLNKEDQNRMRDINFYREAWRAVNSKWWPVIISTGNFQKSKSDETLWSMPVEFTFGGPDNFYTPEIDLGN